MFKILFEYHGQQYGIRKFKTGFVAFFCDYPEFASPLYQDDINPAKHYLRTMPGHEDIFEYTIQVIPI